MEENNDAIDTEQLQRIMSVVRLVKSLSDTGTGTDRQEEAHSTDVQADVTISDETQAINALNAAIPYLSCNYRKPIGIFVKMIEMNKIINSFEVMSVDGDGNNRERKKRMLMAIRPELDIKKQRMLDIFIRVMEIKDILEVMSVAAENR